MDDATRLKLIAEAVRYCQRVKAMGMPPSCYTKALREPVYFLWECRDGRSKERRPKFRSRRAVGMQSGKGTLIYDHAIPLKLLQDDLLQLRDVTVRAVRRLLNRHRIVVLITKAEDRQLGKKGLRSKMPEGWDGVDCLARYKAVGIDPVENAPVATARRKQSINR